MCFDLYWHEHNIVLVFGWFFFCFVLFSCNALQKFFILVSKTFLLHLIIPFLHKLKI